MSISWPVQSVILLTITVVSHNNSRCGTSINPFSLLRLFVVYVHLPDMFLRNNPRYLTNYETWEIVVNLYCIFYARVGPWNSSGEMNKRELLYYMRTGTIRPFAFLTVDSLAQLWAPWFDDKDRICLLLVLYWKRHKGRRLHDEELSSIHHKAYSRIGYRRELERVIGTVDGRKGPLASGERTGRIKPLFDWDSDAPSGTPAFDTIDLRHKSIIQAMHTLDCLQQR